MIEELKKTALYDRHVELGATVIPFAGFLMPLQYTSIVDEHLNVRNNAGLFDVSHMGEFYISGEKSEEFLNYITVNNVSKLIPGQAQYSAMCYENSGIVDDIIVYRFDDYFLMVVNASNIDKDFLWLQKNLISGVELKNISDKAGLIAVQGPKSTYILGEISDINLEELNYYHFCNGRVAGVDVIISRTGYTGEVGYEIFHNIEDSCKIWDVLLDVGEKYGLKPAGLGARDTLRLEMKYCLYGNDIDENTNPIEAGLGWIVDFNKGDFIGRKILIKEKENGPKRKLVAFVVKDKGIPRHGYKIYIDDREIGFVTSGSISPVLNKPIGLGYVLKEYSGIGNKIYIDYRGKRLEMEVVKPPFMKPRTYG